MAPGFGTELEGRHHFRLMKRLGRGGFGSVFLARCLDAGDAPDAPPERVAVKVFPCRTREVHALRRELAALLAIRHPRVPRLHDWSTGGRYAFVAMDHYESGSLAARMAGGGARPDEDEIWTLLEDLLEALAVAHGASVLHLDVKPSNVLIGEDGRYALADFGISEGARGGAAAPRAKGTPGYRAPELGDARYSAIDGRTDLFGAGATAWAFAAGVDLASRRRIAERAEPGGMLPALAQLRPDLSPSLGWVLAELLQADPERRPGSAHAALEQLRGIAGRAEPPHLALPPAGEILSTAAVDEVLAALVDPVTAHACRDPALRPLVVRLAPGELLCSEGERSDCAFLLLRGSLLVESAGRPPLRCDREGELVGEVSALTGRPRGITISAEGPTFVCILNAARFERLVADQPALAVRLLRAMAERYA